MAYEKICDIISNSMFEQCVQKSFYYQFDLQATITHIVVNVDCDIYQNTDWLRDLNVNRQQTNFCSDFRLDAYRRLKEKML